jgi:TRAP-type C4-dicarboxylate transport system substrate-binding protein
MTINTIDDLKPFQEAVAPIYEKYRGIVGADLLDQALATAAAAN